MIGTTIKDFRLIARLGKGGWGEVWAAEQPIVKTRVAIKLLRSEVSEDETHVQRFFNEARAVGGIPHAGIVKIFDVGYAGSQAFLIMELLEGEALTTRIRRETRLPLDEVLELGRQIASVLAATHAAGVVHRDLKPDNVFLVPDAELGERVKVLDFGIAKLSSVQVTGTGALGTPAYMAPEQWHNPATADHRADLYSFGCVLFEMCCGRPPFLATTPGEACAKHLTEPPGRARSLAPALPEAVDRLIDRLLAKAPGDRPDLGEIERVLAQAAVVAPRVHRRHSRGSLAPSSRSNPEAIAETLTFDATPNETVTSLAGAVIAKTPIPARKRRPWLALGLASAGIAGTIAVVATRQEELPEVPATPPAVPTLGLATIENYRTPTPATVIDHRSEQVWLAARDDFARVCKQVGFGNACAGAQLAAGELALLRDDLPGAIAALEVAVRLDPEWSTGYLGLAEARAYARDGDGALAAARRAQELEPGAWQPAMASARAYVSVDKIDEALIEYRRAMAMSPPNNAVMLGEIALAFHYAGKDAEAKRLVEQAAAIDGTLVSVRIVLAELALEAGDGAAALLAAEAALAVSPKNAAAQLARGDALALLDRRDEARAAYRRTLALRGGFNTLGISRTRIAIIEKALARDELPSRTVTVTPTSTSRQRSPSPQLPPIDDERSPPSQPGPVVSAATSDQVATPTKLSRTPPGRDAFRTPPHKVKPRTAPPSPKPERASPIQTKD